MFRTLRNRLILSHILPALLIIPVMGAAMVYVLETRLLLPMVYKNLTADATLIAEITRNQPAFWVDAEISQALVDGISPYISGRVAFVTLDGKILASGDSSLGAAGSQIVDLPDLSGVAQGEAVLLQRGPLAEVFTPVYALTGSPIGIIRMTTRVVTVSDEVYQLRFLLGGVLLFGVLAGIALGSYLAFGINRPIQRVTSSIHTLASGNWHTHLEEQGPEETRMLAQAVNALVAQLNSLEQARRQLLANLVHEIARPLGAVRSAIQALLKGADQDPVLQHELLTGLDGETARLQRLLDDLAGLYGQVLGKLELDRSTVQVREWLGQVLAPWQVAAEQKGVVWSADVPADLPPVVMDADRMAQALGNLLSNATKFTPGGGSVRVTASFENGSLSIRVADNGPGIPEQEQEKVFEPFFRGNQGRRIVQGMGLGLSIARDIARAHGGDIGMESSAQGSLFNLHIPGGTPTPP